MYRGRRLRKSGVIRTMMKETALQVEDFIYPLFVVEGKHVKEEMKSLPGVYHYSLDMLPEIIEEMKQYGVMSCLLFGIPNHKDACGSGAYDEHGIVQEAIRVIKACCEDMYVIADVCMCEYTDHGHCGILDEHGNVHNDDTLPYLNKIAVSCAKAGVDMVAPSDMMDGHITSIRTSLDQAGFYHVAIMGYSAKFASNFYGPFREVAKSTPSFGNRKSYQMDYANACEALREVQADIDEGVDIVMIKPAMAYLDVIANVQKTYNYPIAAYQVSGEYAMLKLAIQHQLINEDAMYESLLAIKRAGAKLIISYEALTFAKRFGQNGTNV